MKLSVVIVNYNVKYFLEQCLHSVWMAGKGIDIEVWVVDNNSVDGSVAMLRKKFPWVRIIENKENLGFSKANNQAIQQSSGEYVLLLNPDTVIEESTFSQILDFMDAHPEAGGLGVKMVDGKGHFLPESKRGLPTPGVAFKKIFGLSMLFPHSKTFGQYHLGYLDKDEIHQVDILSGAFMFLRKTALEKTGLLDEDFFMYGEDIDLSYRIIKAGYKNYYFPKTRIIHYKGESTKKSSVNYVFVFYKAMVVFARKHFSEKNAGMFSFLINLAIYIRAFGAIVSRFFKKIFLPLMDALIIFGGIYLIKNYWEEMVRFKDGGHYPDAFIYIAVPAYIGVWLFSVLLAGGYDKPIKITRIIAGIAAGTLVILLIYSLLGEQLRFSRALILLGSAWAIMVMSGLRYVLSLLKIPAFSLASGKNRRFLIIGDASEVLRIKNLLAKTSVTPGFIGLVTTTTELPEDTNFVGSIHQLSDIIRIYKIDEAIFCSRSMPPEQIIDYMSDLQSCNIDYKIAPPESLSIIGSNSINTSGELYTLSVNAISHVSNKRSKRVFDLAISVLLFSTYPIGLFFVTKPISFLWNIFLVHFGVKTWVGYIPHAMDIHKLPKIKPSVLHSADTITNNNLSDEFIENANMLYAKDYSLKTDFLILLKGFRKLGRT